ncbi:MAG: hypothetical protein HYX65_01370 [Gemmatimonadetes bacterium]|nr:hypothetical protein [Gemmatimonadota bacterium]
MSDVVGVGAAWLVTWFAHSFAACALALAAGALVLRSPHARDLLWKGAIVVPLLTSFVARAAPSSGAVTVRVDATAAGTVLNVASAHDPTGLGAAATGWGALIVLASGAAALSILVRRRRRAAVGWRSRVAIGPEALGLGPSAVALRGGRSAVLSACDTVGSAAVVGAREVCVSPAVLLALPPAEREGVVLHEVAHIDRRDRAWLIAADVVAAVLVLQPLARVVARRLRRDAELACDEAAVRRTGGATNYVRALAQLAARFEAEESGAVAFASGASPLEARARRVLSGPRPPGFGVRLAGWLAVAGVALACLAAPRLPARGGARSLAAQAQVTRTNVAGEQTVQVTIQEAPPAPRESTTSGGVHGR